MTRITAGKQGEWLEGGRGGWPQGASWCREWLWGSGEAAAQAELLLGPEPSPSLGGPPAAPSALLPSETAPMHQNPMWGLVLWRVGMAK